jgi:hypothetical protein
MKIRCSDDLRCGSYARTLNNARHYVLESRNLVFELIAVRVTAKEKLSPIINVITKGYQRNRGRDEVRTDLIDRTECLEGN